MYMYAISLLFYIILCTLKFILLLYIKTSTTLLFLVNISANIEAYTTLNKKSFEIIPGRFSNNFILPPSVNSISDDTLISELLYKLLVFDLMYARVGSSGYSLLKYFTLKRTLILLFYYYTGLNNIILLTLKTLFKLNVHDSRNIILYKLFIHFNDSRRLIKINNKWVANGDLRFRLFFTTVCKQYPMFKEDAYTIDKLKKVYDSFNKSGSIRSSSCIFKCKHGKIGLHTTYNITRDNGIIGFRTSLNKAQLNSNYDRQLIVNRFEGGSKPTTILSIYTCEILQTKTSVLIPSANITLGSVLYGYNKHIITDGFSSSIYYQRDSGFYLM